MTNDNWQDSQAAEIIATGIPPQNDMESAIVATLPPGHYTAVLAGEERDHRQRSGRGLRSRAGQQLHLANLSTRGFVGAGDNAMIGSLIIGSGDSPIMVFRAIGPTLASSGIVNPLLDPTIELHDGNGAPLGFNDNWRSPQSQAVVATQLAPTDDREAAIVTPFLAPGNYTAIVRGKDDTTGVALVEAYRIPVASLTSVRQLALNWPSRPAAKIDTPEGPFRANTVGRRNQTNRGIRMKTFIALLLGCSLAVATGARADTGPG